MVRKSATKKKVTQKPLANRTRTRAKSRATSSTSRRVDRLDLPKPLLAILDEHKYHVRLLKLLEAEGEKLRAHGTADYECMESIMHYMNHFPDRYHHPKEDLIFDRISGVNREIQDAIVRLKRDHKQMAKQSQAIRKQITVQKDMADKAKAAQLAKEITSYVNALLDHIKFEESVVFKPARESLTATDWDEIDQAIQPINDPLFGDERLDRYIGLMQRYVNDFVVVSSSGKLPVRLLESTLTSMERAVYSIGEIASLPTKLAKIHVDIAKGRFKLAGELARVRRFDAFGAWAGKVLDRNEADWQRILNQFRNTLDAIDLVSDSDRMNTTFAPITLRTEKEIRILQEEPHVHNRNPRISWQAAATNLLSRAIGKPLLGSMGPTKAKAILERHGPEMKDVSPPGTRVEPIKDSGFDGVWILPNDDQDSSRVIMYLPGGGFFLPATNAHRMLAAKLGQQTQSRTLLVNYRLLPEHPFPAGLEDALSAYRYLIDKGFSPREITVVGDSAGGSMTLALLLALRDEGLPLPVASGLLSPSTDMTGSTASRKTNRWRDSAIPSQSRQFTRELEIYLKGIPADSPLISPVYGSFEGLPPTFALVSSTESFLDDTLVVARKARSQGVDFEVEIWENLPHDWVLFSFIPESTGAVEHLIDFLNHHLGERAQTRV